MLLGLVATVAATGLAGASLTGKHPMGAFGGGIGIAAAVVTGVGILLFALGITELVDSSFGAGPPGSGSDVSWGAGFYLTIAAAVLALAGGVMALLGKPTTTPTTRRAAT